MAKQLTSFDCSGCSYTLGLSLRKCLRLCSVIGLASAALYIMAGSSIIVHVAQTEKIVFTSRITSVSDERTKTLHTRNRGGFFICLSTVLIIINVIQVISDVLLFRMTLRSSKGKSLWIYFLFDIILWVMTLICFTAIFSGGGLFLLLVFLLGSTVRVYIIFILHQYMNQLRKATDDAMRSGYVKTNVSTISSPPVRASTPPAPVSTPPPVEPMPPDEPPTAVEEVEHPPIRSEENGIV